MLFYSKGLCQWKPSPTFNLATSYLRPLLFDYIRFTDSHSLLDLLQGHIVFLFKVFQVWKIALELQHRSHIHRPAVWEASPTQVCLKGFSFIFPKDVNKVVYTRPRHRSPVVFISGWAIKGKAITGAGVVGRRWAWEWQGEKCLFILAVGNTGGLRRDSRCVRGDEMPV